MATVLITGANRGIGLALAQRYVSRGDQVIACCREPKRAAQLSCLGESCTRLPLEVTDEVSIAALSTMLSGTAIDVLINNAGIIGQAMETQTATTIDFASWMKLFEVNTIGPARMLQALLPHLKRATQPKVVNVTSDLGALSHDDAIFFGYSASKAALNKFMRLAAIELKAQRVAVGLIHPGWVQTDMGGAKAPVSPETSAEGIIKVIDSLTLEKSGGFWCWDGRRHDW